LSGKEFVERKYDSISRFYDFFELPMELLFFKRWRRLAISRLKSGRVLEVGVGTGKNLPYYDSSFEIYGIDISEKMLLKAKKRAKRLNISLKIYKMDVQNLEFPDNYFDGEFSTFVFCSVPDPIAGLSELMRVLKKDGIAVFLEHVRPKGLLGLIFDFFNPISVRLIGVNINRNTVENIKEAGFEILEENDLLFDVFKLIVAKPLGKEV
jgi:ubiquinone/menaquinone biosynthesis C-methylase UbiE